MLFFIKLNYYYWEEVSVMSKLEEKDGNESYVCFKNNFSSKDFFKFLWIRNWRRFDFVFWNGYDGFVVKDCNNENYKGRKVKFLNESYEYEV